MPAWATISGFMLLSFTSKRLHALLVWSFGLIRLVRLLEGGV